MTKFVSKVKCVIKKVILAFAVFALALTGCNKNAEEKNEVTKIADYLYELKAKGYGTEAPVALLTNTDPVKFGCSAVRNGNFYGRNLDLSINEI